MGDLIGTIIGIHFPYSLLRTRESSEAHRNYGFLGTLMASGLELPVRVCGLQLRVREFCAADKCTETLELLSILAHFRHWPTGMWRRRGWTDVVMSAPA